MEKIRVENVEVDYALFGRRRRLAPDADDSARDVNARFRLGRDGRTQAFAALQDISFSLEEGQRLGIMGANGSGKSTLLQVIGGVLPPSRGRVVLTGEPIGLYNLTHGVKPEATGHRNITLRGLAAGLTLDRIEEKRADIAKFSGLGAFLDMPVATYSAGMKMRLLFSIATALDPDILLLDEWIGAGDHEFRQKAKKRMAEFVERAGAIVLVSHRRSLLESVCDVGLWLEHGRIKALDAMKEVAALYEDA